MLNRTKRRIPWAALVITAGVLVLMLGSVWSLSRPTKSQPLGSAVGLEEKPASPHSVASENPGYTYDDLERVFGHIEPDDGVTPFIYDGVKAIPVDAGGRVIGPRPVDRTRGESKR